MTRIVGATLALIIRTLFAVASYAASLFALTLLQGDLPVVTVLLGIAAACFLLVPFPVLLSARAMRSVVFVSALTGMGAALFAVLLLVGGDLVAQPLDTNQAALLGTALTSGVLGVVAAGFLDERESVTA